MWGAGFVAALADVLGPARERAGVSAGAAMAVLVETGRAAPALAHFMAITAQNARNVHLFGPLRGGRFFPHEAMYREVVHRGLEDGGFEAVRQGAPVRIGLVSIQPGRSPMRSAWRAFKQFSRLEASRALHGPPAAEPELEWRVETAGEAPDAATLVDWIVASSASPPVTRALRIEGRIHLDAGLVENVPVRALSTAAQRGAILVVLARPQQHGPVYADGHRLYVAPEAWPPVKRWDYTRPDLAQATYDLGHRAGEALRSRIVDFFGEALTPEAPTRAG